MADPVIVVFVQGAGAGAHDADAALAGDLSRRLGDGFDVVFPRMPLEDDPDFERWSDAVGEWIARAPASAPIVLVGHSLGGYVLIRHLADVIQTAEVVLICLIAAPFPAGDPDWVFDGFELPDDVGERLPAGVPVIVYAAEDDEVVPFAHRDLYVAALPQSVRRTVRGGHQLGGDLTAVADDIRLVAGGGELEQQIVS